MAQLVIFIDNKYNVTEEISLVLWKYTLIKWLYKALKSTVQWFSLSIINTYGMVINGDLVMEGKSEGLT